MSRKQIGLRISETMLIDLHMVERRLGISKEEFIRTEVANSINQIKLAWAEKALYL